MGLRIWLDDMRPMPDGYDMAVSDEFLLEALIRRGKVAHISFDHDLGEGKGTGYGVACFIEKLAQSGAVNPITWDVHSDNPVGRKNIQNAMKSAERFWYKHRS
jgi:hypothetical protein